MLKAKLFKATRKPFCYLPNILDTKYYYIVMAGHISKLITFNLHETQGSS